jgi:hypothetical protein
MDVQAGMMRLFSSLEQGVGLHQLVAFGMFVDHRL